MPVGALAVSNLLIWTFAEFIFSLSVLTVEWKSRKMCEFFASGGWEENDILLDNLQLLCFFPVVLFLGKGCSGLSGRDGSFQPCVEKFFRGREKSCFFRVAGVCPWPVKHVPCRPKGGIPGRLRFFCLCRAGVYGLFLDVRRVGGWRLFHGQGSGTAPGRLTEGRLSGWRLQGC